MSFSPKHGELRGSDRWDNISKAWIRADQWQEREWARQDRRFAKMANQGDLCAPMLIHDSIGKDIESQVTGKWYDSKSMLRREYKEHNVIEVGNDVPKTRFVHGNRPYHDPYLREKAINKSIDKAFNRMGMPPV